MNVQDLTFREAVTLYHRLGMSLFPLHPRTKNPLVPKWGPYQLALPSTDQVQDWFIDFWDTDKPANIGIVTGKISQNLVDLELDTRSLSDDYLHRQVAGIEDETMVLANATMAYQSKRGCHIFLRVRDLPPTIHPGSIGILADKHFSMVPPSVHPNGTHYVHIGRTDKILEVSSLEDIGLDLPKLITDHALDGHVTVGKDGTPKKTPAGWMARVLPGLAQGEGRHIYTPRLGMYYRAIRSWTEDATLASLLAWNRHNSPPLPTSYIERTVRYVYQRPCQYQRYSSWYDWWNVTIPTVKAHLDAMMLTKAQHRVVDYIKRQTVDSKGAPHQAAINMTAMALHLGMSRRQLYRVTDELEQRWILRRDGRMLGFELRTQMWKDR